ncbi:hypothetical protein [Victivallis sp. Marseille-Q1083]|uniref:hypothetical protein n=1 Tax=Victivallis sp. Marseille-Q1083 TaxID=2717288 RepID=UPI00158BC089|nr:hypothetical protein [Victivallis sp. Marseille-Q1083]
MNRLALLKKTLVLLVLGICSTGLMAGFWDWTTPYQGPSKDVTTLVITGNYVNPRLLADVIQAHTRQPYLLLPLENDEYFYWCPRGKDAVQKIHIADFSKFVKFLNPRQIIILGDDHYVPRRFRAAIDPAIPVMIMTGDWENIAASLERSQNINNLASDYSKLRRELKQRNIYVPAKVPAATQPAGDMLQEASQAVVVDADAQAEAEKQSPDGGEALEAVSLDIDSSAVAAPEAADEPTE